MRNIKWWVIHMTQGTIRRVNSWKNQKGFFFLLNEVEGEWFSYGMPTFKLGDHVQFEPMSRKLNKATQVRFGKAKDGNLVKAEGSGSAKQSFTSVVGGLPSANSQVEEFFDASEVKPIYKPTDKDSVITRLACLKAAAEYSKGLSDLTIDEVLKVAKAFEKYAKTGE